MASPKKKSTQKSRTKKNGPPVADSPITVGGGGVGPAVELGFDHEVYVSDPDDPDNYVSPDRTLASISIDDVYQDLDPESEIVIAFKKGGANKTITIAPDPPDFTLGVKFDPTLLRYNHRRKKHRDDGSQLMSLTINGATTNLNDNVVIIIHTD